MNGWIKKHWYAAVPVIITVGVLIYGAGKHEQHQDSVMKANTEACQENTDAIKEVKDDVQLALRNQERQNTFFELLRPDLWRKAENDTDSMPGD